MQHLQVTAPATIRRRVDGRARIGGSRDLSACLAITGKTREDAFALRHKSYLSGGYIDARADGLFHDAYDDQPNSQSIVVYRDQEPVASVRVCILDTDPAVTGWDDIPARKIFPREVDALVLELPRREGPASCPRAIEINRLVRHPRCANDPELVFALFRMAAFLIEAYRTDLTLSCVRPNHAGFYKRLHFGKVAGPRRYDGVKFDTDLMACPRSAYANVPRDLPILDMGAAAGALDGLFRGEAVPVFAGP